MSIMHMVQALNAALAQEMDRDASIVVLGEDVGAYGGVFRVTEGLQKRFGRTRVFDTPLAESAIVGASMGMACFGLKPVCEVQFEGFLAPAFDQIINKRVTIKVLNTHNIIMCGHYVTMTKSFLLMDVVKAEKK